MLKLKYEYLSVFEQKLCNYTYLYFIYVKFILVGLIILLEIYLTI